MNLEQLTAQFFYKFHQVYRFQYTIYSHSFDTLILGKRQQRLNNLLFIITVRLIADKIRFYDRYSP